MVGSCKLMEPTIKGLKSALTNALLDVKRRKLNQTAPSTCRRMACQTGTVCHPITLQQTAWTT